MLTEENLHKDNLPQLSLHENNAKRLLSGIFVPSGYVIGESITKLEKPYILRPPKFTTEIVRPDENNQTVDDQNNFEDDRGSLLNEALIFYLSSPLNYFNKFFEEKKIISPIDEIKQQIEKTRSELPSFSEASKILLRSPINKIRISEKERLLKEGISVQDIETFLSPETALVNVSELNFIRLPEQSGSLEAFYSILDEAIEELLVIDAEVNEQIKHASKFAEYLTIFSEAFMYQTANFKINNPLLLEKIAKKIEFLVESNLFLNSAKKMQGLFDFIAHFEMNNRTASSIFLDILKNNNFQHPLIHELIYQLKPEERIDPEQPRIGIEIEAIPLILFGSCPANFELGIDDGDTMPELRRDNQKLNFDNQYKKELFDLWYWAKMIRLKGASLHIHIDDESGQKLNTFQSIFGLDDDSLRGNQKHVQTAELRFNLNEYVKKDKDEVNLVLSKPFFHQQYDIAQFIEVLLQIGENRSLDKVNILIDKLPYFWAVRFRELQNTYAPLTSDQIEDLCEAPHLNKYVMQGALSKLNESLNTDQIMSLCNKFYWDANVVEAAISRFEGSLTVEQVIDFCDKVSWDICAKEAIISKLSDSFTINQAINLCEKSYWDKKVVKVVFLKFSGFVTINQAINLCKKCDYDEEASKVIFSKLQDFLTANQLMEILNSKKNEFIKLNSSTYANKTKSPMDIIRSVFYKFDLFLPREGEPDSEIHFDQMKELANITKTTINALNDFLTIDQVMYLCKNSNYREDVTRIAFDKFNGLLTLEQIMDLYRRSYKNQFVANFAFDKLDNSFSFDELINFIDVSNLHYNKFETILSKFDGSLTLEQIMDLCKRSDYDVNVANIAFSKLDGFLSTDQIIDLCEIYDWHEWDARFIQVIFSKLPNDGRCDNKFISNFLGTFPEDERLIMWSTLAQNSFQKPVILNQIINLI